MIYDVSVALKEGCQVFPGDPEFHRSFVHSLEKGDDTNLSLLNFGAHTGTHIDAPLHMLPGESDVTAFADDVLVGPARVVTISNPKSVTVDELRSKPIGGVKRLLLKTRNSTLWSQPTFSTDFVYLEPAAAQLLGELGIKLVGFDYLSIEKYGGEGFPSHLSLMYRKIVIVEGLNLSSVSEGDYLLFCGPLKLSGSEGAPARVMLADQDSMREWQSKKL